MSRIALQGAALAAVVMSVPVPARGQLPFIPSSGAGPDLRFASTDELSDQVSALEQKVERIREERNPEIESQRSEIATELEEALGGAGVVSPEDLQRLHALLDALQREHELYEAARILLERAGEAVKAEPSLPPGPTDLPSQLAVELEARRLAEALVREAALAQRLEALAASEPESDEPALSATERVSEAEGRVVRARALHAAAKTLEARARARRASRLAELSRERIEVEDRAVEAARLELARLEKDVDAELADIAKNKKRLAPIDRRMPRGLSRAAQERLRAYRRELRLARLELLDRRVLAAESRRTRAKTKVWALEKLAEDAPELTEIKTEQSRLAAQIARLDSRQSSAESELALVRDEERKLRAQDPLARALSARRHVLRDAFEVLVDVRQNLETAKVMTDIVAARASLARRSVSRAWAVLLSLVVLAVAFFLVRYGLGFVSWMLSPDNEDGRHVSLSDRRAGQIHTALTLLWPLAIVATAAAILAWPVWALEVSFLEALQAIDRPLFYVDTSGVSVFSLLKLLFAIWLAVVLSRALRRILSARVFPQLQWDIGLTNALDTLVHYVVVGIGLLIGLRFVGVGFSSLAIFAGVLGIGIGFGLRNITENFFSGLIILAERPIKIGDFIEVEGRVEGRVTRIQARSTTVVTRDNISVIIPNSEFVSKPVVNLSYGDPKVRIPVEVGVVYGSDTDLVRKMLLEVAGRHGHVLKRPAPEVQFRAFGGSSLDFVLLVWVDEQLHRFRIASDLHFAIDKTFRKMEIEIAFPQLDLHLKSVTHEWPRRLSVPAMEQPECARALPEKRPSSHSGSDISRPPRDEKA